MRSRYLWIPAVWLAAACGGSDKKGPTEPPPDTTGNGNTVIVGAAGNIATCGTNNDEATAKLLDGLPGYVFALGDQVIPHTNADSMYTNCYEPTWGRHKARTYAVMGNHEYGTGTADVTFRYFGPRAGEGSQGYYSFDIGEWHVIVLNDNAGFVPIGTGTAQEAWLKADLAANTKKCTIAMFHQPYYLSSNVPGFTVRPTLRSTWRVLYEAGVDVVLNGHQHHYERMQRLDPEGTPDDVKGIRQFNVGTGGESVAMPSVISPFSEARAAVFGVLKLTLKPTAYDWEFLAIPGASFTDSGSGTCH